MAGIPSQYLMVFRQKLPRWDTIYNACVEFLYNLILGKADANHTHGAGGVVLTICTSTTRPAEPTLGMLISETDTGIVRQCLSTNPVTWSSPGATQQWVNMLPLSIASLVPDDQAPPDATTNIAYDGLTFPNSAGAWAWSDFKAWLDGVAWRVVMEGLMTTGSASGVGINVAYLVAGSGAIGGVVKTRRANSTPYALNDLRLPPVPNGHYYKCTTAGTSAVSAPTFATGAGSTTTDGTAIWTEQGVSFKTLTLTVVAPATAYTRFDIDNASLQIPAADVALGNRVYFAVWRDAADAHTGDLVLTSLKIQPVEV